MRRVTKKRCLKEEIRGAACRKFIMNLGALNMGDGITTEGHGGGTDTDLANRVRTRMKAELVKAGQPSLGDGCRVVEELFVFPPKDGKLGHTAADVRAPACVIRFSSPQIAKLFWSAFKVDGTRNIMPGRVKIRGYDEDVRFLRSLLHPLVQSGDVKNYQVRPLIDENDGEVSMEVKITCRDDQVLNHNNISVAKGLAKRKPSEVYLGWHKIKAMTPQQAVALAKTVKFGGRVGKKVDRKKKNPYRDPDQEIFFQDDDEDV